MTQINQQQSTGSNKPLFIYLLTAILAGVIAIAYLLIIPQDPKNSLYLGYSARRLLLMGFIAVPTAGTTILLIFINKSAALAQKLRTFLFSTPVVIVTITGLSISSLVFIATWISIAETSKAVLERLRPIILWIMLITAFTSWYQWRYGKTFFMPELMKYQRLILGFSGRIQLIIIKTKRVFSRPALNIIIILVISSPLWLQNAFRHPYPIGVAGLYALMAQTIADTQFVLPHSIPFYGPGGIPFAYPPLAFYIMAFFTDVININPITYMRFAGPLFSLLALIPMYLLAKRISGSAAAASIAAMITATYSRIYIVHGQAAGLCRAMAFFIVLFGLYFFYRSIQNPRRPLTLLAALFFGLTILTHPTYVEFFGLSALLFSITGARDSQTSLWNRFIIGSATMLGGLLLASPWLATIVNRHDWDVFLFASNSHDSMTFLYRLTNLDALRTTFIDFFYKLNKTPLMAGPTVLGLIWLLVQKRFRLVLWFVSYIILFGGYDFLIIPIAAIISALLLLEIGNNISPIKEKHPEISAGVGSFLFVSIIIGLLWLAGYAQIGSFNPSISGETLKMAKWFQQNTEQDALFQHITGSPEEAEWYPYILQRTPALSSWGAEWNGDYKGQYMAVNQLAGCANEGSLQCIQNIFQEMDVKPDYLITNNGNTRLNSELENTSQWSLEYQNAAYAVWKYSLPQN